MAKSLERTKIDKCRDRFFEAQTEFDRIRVLKKQRSENDKNKKQKNNDMNFIKKNINREKGKKSKLY